MKKCKRCHQVKPIDDFAHRAGSTDGRQSWCRPCMTSYHRQWRTDVRAEPPTAPRRVKLENHYAELRERWGRFGSRAR